MARPDVEYLMADQLELVPLARFGLPLGWRGQRLSHDFASGESSYIAHIMPHWLMPDTASFGTAIQLLILSGSIWLNGQKLTRGHYARLPTGTFSSHALTDEQCVLIFMTECLQPSTAPDTPDIYVSDILKLPWQVAPSFEGRSADETPPGVMVKWLYENPESGAYTLITRQLPGWYDPDLEAHRCWEELLLLEGDYLMGANGAVTAGCYIFRNGETPHGPQASRHGSIWFCRGNARIDFQYSKTTWAQPQIDRYFNGSDAQLNDQTNLSPWGDWHLPNNNF